MNVIDVGSIVKIIYSDRPSEIGAIGRIVYLKNNHALIRTIGGNMIIKTRLNRVIRFNIDKS